MVVGSMALGVAACGDSGGGGAVTSDEALRGLMDTIALDFAQVLADVAPAYDQLALKAEGAVDCPEGGSASWVDSGFGGGTLTLTACRMKGIDLSGTLGGYLESTPMDVGATMMSGPITASGSYSAELDVRNFYLSAQLPITDFSTYWEVWAALPDGVGVCAWSGGPGCAPSAF